MVKTSARSAAKARDGATHVNDLSCRQENGERDRTVESFSLVASQFRSALIDAVGVCKSYLLISFTLSSTSLR